MQVISSALLQAHSERVGICAAFIVIPDTALAFLGAQKDAALATIGGLITVSLSRRHIRQQYD